MNERPTIAQALNQAGQLGLPRIDAQLLLCHVLAPMATDRAWLVAHDQDLLSTAQNQQWQTLLHARLLGQPVAYLTGQKSFFGLNLQINAHVLDPRPDTETLVEWALTLLKTMASARVLDMGTGSGAIALALAAHAPLPLACIVGVDRSPDALAVAQANGLRLQLPIQWCCSDWFMHVQGRFDLIVSNPPYIAEGDPHLPALKYEPQPALISGPDGLRDLQHLIEHAPAHLKPKGWLLLEHGHDQAQAVQQGLRKRGFVHVQSRCDLSGIERCTGGQWPAME